LFGLIAVTVIARVVPLELQKRIINRAISLKKMDLLFIYCGFYLGAVVLAGSLNYLINVLQGYLGQKIFYEMRTELYQHVLRLPLPFFRRTPPGMVISSLTSELAGVGDFLGSALAVPLINVLTLCAFAGYLLYLNPLLALLSFGIYPIEIAIIPMLQKRYNRINFERIDVNRSLSNTIGEAIAGVHKVQAHGGYPIEGRNLELLLPNWSIFANGCTYSTMALNSLTTSFRIWALSSSFSWVGILLWLGASIWVLW